MGIVYVLTNPMFPNLLKIGCTAHSMKKRLAELNRNMPERYFCIGAWEFDDHIGVERTLHEAFEDFRHKNNREFFDMHPDRVIVILEQFGRRNVPSDKKPSVVPVEKTEPAETPSPIGKRAKPFRFKMVGIRPGAILSSVWDRGVTCRVVDDQRVEYAGKVMSLSEAAVAVAQERGNKSKSLRGPAFWCYGDPPITLAALRDRAQEAPSNRGC